MDVVQFLDIGAWIALIYGRFIGLIKRTLLTSLVVLLLLYFGVWIGGFFTFVTIQLIYGLFSHALRKSAWMWEPAGQLVKAIVDFSGFKEEEAPPPPPPPPPLTWWNVTIGMLPAMPGPASIPFTLIGMYLCGAVAILSGGYLLWWVLSWMFGNMAREAVYKMRGISYESMRPGSEIAEKGDPSYQVDIVDVGLFSTVHVGHGIRVGDVIVVPTHVVRDVKNQGGIRGPKNGKIVFYHRNEVIDGQLVGDVSYIPMQSSKLSDLQVAKAPRPGALARKIVSISSRGRGSHGVSTPSNTEGCINYLGSTVPGFSGAAYHDQTRWYGMHTGAGTTSNLGIAAIVICHEVAHLFKPESGENHEEYYGAIADRRGRKWYESDANLKDWVDRQMENKYLDTITAETDFDADNLGATYVSKKGKRAERKLMEIIDPSNPISWADEVDFENAAPEKLETMAQTLEILAQKARLSASERQLKLNLGTRVKVKSQNNNGGEVLLGPLPLAPLSMREVDQRIRRSMDAVQTVLMKEIDQIKNELTRIGIEVEKLKTSQVVIPPEQQLESSKLGKPREHKGFQCCGRNFKSELALEAHKRMAKEHRVATESADPTDFKQRIKTDKTGAFLGKRLPRKKFSRSENTSPTNKLENLSSAIVESQSRMESLMENFMKCCQPMLQRMAGLDSDIVPK